MVRKSSDDMRSRAMREAKVTSVKKELTSRMEAHIN